MPNGADPQPVWLLWIVKCVPTVVAQRAEISKALDACERGGRLLLNYTISLYSEAAVERADAAEGRG